MTDVEGSVREALKVAIVTLLFITWADCWETVGVRTLVEIKADCVECGLVNLVCWVQILIDHLANFGRVIAAIAVRERTELDSRYQGPQAKISRAGHDFVAW